MIHATRIVARHSPWDALFVALAVAHGLLLLAVPTLPVVAVGLWWNSNTVSHNFIHRPFFRSRLLNALFGLYLSALLGIPQSVWRDRHLAHHRGGAWRVRCGRQMAAEILVVFALWVALATLYTTFFWAVYVPGYALGLGLCWLHGHYEHAGETTSHYGRLYNLLFFNDGYHAQHHARPGVHWTELPGEARADVPASRWPAVLRWLDALSLDGLERFVLRSACLQSFMIARHERAFRRLLPALPAAPRIAVVGGGLFPRTLLALRRIVPDASFVVIDFSAANIAVARPLAPPDVVFDHCSYEPALVRGFDVVVFPLAFSGDRPAIYRDPPAPVVFVHDWIWQRRGASAVVSLLLLKRLNCNTVERRPRGGSQPVSGGPHPPAPSPKGEGEQNQPGEEFTPPDTPPAPPPL